MSPKLEQLNLNRQSCIDEKNNLKLAFSMQHILANVQIKLNKSMELSATFRDMETFIRGLQDQICNGLEAFEPIQRFQQDIWEREQGGWLDKYSAVGKPWKSRSKYLLHPWRDDKEQLLRLRRSLGRVGFHWSFIQIPQNSSHMNVRYFETKGQSWFRWD